MPAGRPSELTPEIVAQVGPLLRRVLFVETVADQIGVDRITFRRWLKAGGREARQRDRGKDPDPKLDLHVELCSAVKKALAESQGGYVELIAAAATQQWQAAAWTLERRWPEQWGGNKAELRELRKQLAAILAAKQGAAPGVRPDPHGPAGAPPADDGVE